MENNDFKDCICPDSGPEICIAINELDCENCPFYVGIGDLERS